MLTVQALKRKDLELPVVSASVGHGSSQTLVIGFVAYGTDSNRFSRDRGKFQRETPRPFSGHPCAGTAIGSLDYN